MLNIGESIRNIRIRKSIKAIEIYTKIGVSQSTYSKIENNKYKIDIATLHKIATILQVDVSVLLADKKASNFKVEDQQTDFSKTALPPNSYDKWIGALESQIELLKEQVSIYKREIKEKHDENLDLRNENLRLQERIVSAGKLKQ